MPTANIAIRPAAGGTLGEFGIGLQFIVETAPAARLVVAGEMVGTIGIFGMRSLAMNRFLR